MNIVITSQSYQVTVNTYGAELKSFQNPAKKEFVWNSDPKFWVRSSPLLFPTIGNVRNNKTFFNGKEYELPKHGFCKESEFEILSQGDNFVSLRLKANDSTLTQYPFHFELTLSYKLVGSTLEMTYTVKNCDTKDMPYHIGAHPGFMCPLEKEETLSDYVLEFEKEEKFETLIYDLNNLCFLSQSNREWNHEGTRMPLSKEMFDQDAVYFPSTLSRSVSLINPKTQKGVKLNYTDFKSIAFWTPIGGNAPFLCLEPWNGSAIYDDEDNVFEHKRDVIISSSGEEQSYHLSINLLGY